MKLSFPDSLPRVQSQFPITEGAHRIAFIGEAPGMDEHNAGQPFVGASGQFLEKALTSAKILRSTCLMANVCQVQPPSNQIVRFSWGGVEIQTGLEQLRADLQEFKPHLCVLLGNLALKAAKDPSNHHPLKSGVKGYEYSITAERGSLFECRDPNSPMFGFKCLGTLHPAAIIRRIDQLPLFRFDISRAADEGTSPVLHLPLRHFEIGLSSAEILTRLGEITPSDLLSIDIEGGIVAENKSVVYDEDGNKGKDYKPSWIPHLSISTDPKSAFIIDFSRLQFSEEIQVLSKLSEVLYNPEIAKVLQNGLYDAMVLAWSYKILIRNILVDTMISGWEIYPELPKALGVQASIWTREPYWKSDRKKDSLQTRLEYCCKDSAVTLEIALGHLEAFTDKQRKHYLFNASLVPLMLYAQLKGINHNNDFATLKSKQYQVHLDEIFMRMEAKLKPIGAWPFNPKSPLQVKKVLYDLLSFPESFDLLSQSRSYVIRD